MLKLGRLQIKGDLVLAPMAGITDYPFRKLVMEYGCGLGFTGLVSAEGLIRKKEGLIRIEEDEHPVSVQLFGSDPGILAASAQRVESLGADAVDINMGCPAGQVVDAGAGAALMRAPEDVKKILRAVRKVLHIPLTVKIRSGWNEEQLNAVGISKIAEDSGVDAITIHPRTKVQGFRGRADWGLIREAKSAVSIPVIGNGDVTSRALAEKMKEETGCDAVMIGRGVLGNPWIFVPEDPDRRDGMPALVPSPQERGEAIQRHYLLLEGYYGEEKALVEIRKHAFWYSRGLPGSASFRAALTRLKEKEPFLQAMREFFSQNGE